MALDPDARNRLRNMIAQGVLLSVDDAAKVQILNGSFLDGEVLRGLVRPQWFGFTSTPPANLGLLALFPHGDRSLGFVLGVADHLYRPLESPAGTSAIYSSAGATVTVHANGDVTVTAPANMRLQAGGILRLDGDGVEIHGRTYVQTDVQGRGQRETWAGGVSYVTDSYTTGADPSGTEHGLNQPALASDYWDDVEGE